MNQVGAASELEAHNCAVEAVFVGRTLAFFCSPRNTTPADWPLVIRLQVSWLTFEAKNEFKVSSSFPLWNRGCH